MNRNSSLKYILFVFIQTINEWYIDFVVDNAFRLNY